MRPCEALFEMHERAESVSEGDGGRYLVVGLGNPGRSHERNRHNIGFMVVDRLAEVLEIELNRARQGSIIGNGRLAGSSFLIAKPQTFMNRSGQAISSLVRYFKIPLANSLVVYDEIDLPLGTLRLREKGGSGGHNGMKSIISQLGTGFPRMRLGVGRPPGAMDPAKYVLKDFGESELPLVAEMIDAAVSAVHTFLLEGIDLAMTRHNGHLGDAQ
jgi:PTH1 family peptidyl-tRNA hydrolase